jgi:putative FmdB family regulatory protein
MPTYDYKCDACGHKFEQFQSITASSLTKCPHCGKRALQRLIGTGGGIIFKGSGFYQTDYRSESYKKAAEAEKSASTPSGTSKDSVVKSAEKPAATVKPKKPAKKDSATCKAE